jgi:hypothetical protein
MDFPRPPPRSRGNSRYTRSLADTRYSDQPSRTDRAAGKQPSLRMIEGSGRDSSSVASPGHCMQLVPRNPQLAMSRYNEPPQQIPPLPDEDHLVWERDSDRRQRSSASDFDYLLDEGSCRSGFEIIDEVRHPSVAPVVPGSGHDNYLPYEQYVSSSQMDDFEDDDSEGSLGFIEVKYTRNIYSAAAAGVPYASQTHSQPDPRHALCVESIELRRRPTRAREEDIMLGSGARDYHDRGSEDYHCMSSREYDSRNPRDYDDRTSGEHRERRLTSYDDRRPRGYDDRASREYYDRRPRECSDRVSGEYDGGDSRGYDDNWRPRDYHDRRSREYHGRRHESRRSRAEEYTYR